MMAKEFEMSMISELSFLLGLQVNQKKRLNFHLSKQICE
jgi:hypothetical protein